MKADAISLVDNEARSRFEFDLEGQMGLIDYRKEGGRVHLLHTEVPAALGGRGYGSEMVKQALAEIKKDGDRVVPRCSFVAAYIDKNPEWQDMVAA